MKALLEADATREDRAACAAHYCLDRGVAASTPANEAAVARGDPARGYRSKRAVTAIHLGSRVPTVHRSSRSPRLLPELLIGVALGVIAAVRRKSLQDH